MVNDETSGIVCPQIAFNTDSAEESTKRSLLAIVSAQLEPAFLHRRAEQFHQLSVGTYTTDPVNKFHRNFSPHPVRRASFTASGGTTSAFGRDTMGGGHQQAGR
ncbi:hypothetical protein Bbelb_270230 [Branchiostoma belcheri]|nr:hypothetical protein Bbelb_270230 [Branchiostoma belcheri]